MFYFEISGQGIPTGQAGHLLVKTETGQYQIVKVGPSAGAPTAAVVSTAAMSTSVSSPNIVRTPVARISAPTVLAPSNSVQARPSPPACRPTSIPSGSAAGSPAPKPGGAGGMGRGQMTPDTAKMKCKNFLVTLQRLAEEQPPAVAENVRSLIQGLIDGRIVPETFAAKLQRELDSSPQPCLVPFLKRSLPFLQNSLSNGELIIQGVRAPSQRTSSRPSPMHTIKSVTTVVRTPVAHVVAGAPKPATLKSTTKEKDKKGKTTYVTRVQLQGELKDLKQELNEKQKKLAATDEEKNECRKQLHKVQQENSQKDIVLKDLEQELNEKQKKLAATDEEKRKLEISLYECREQLHKVKQENSQKDIVLKDLEQELNEKQKKLVDTEEEKRKIQMSRFECREQLHKVQQKKDSVLKDLESQRNGILDSLESVPNVSQMQDKNECFESIIVDKNEQIQASSAMLEISQLWEKLEEKETLINKLQSQQLETKELLKRKSPPPPTTEPIKKQRVDMDETM